MQNQPSRLTFWRLVLATSGSLAWMAMGEAFELARKLGIAPLTSKTWLAVLGGLTLVGAGSLLLLALSFGPGREKLINALQSSEHAPRALGLLLPVALAIYPLSLYLPYYGGLLAKQDWLRLFLFWMAALLATLGIKLVSGKLTWPAALLSSLLLQSAITRVALYLPNISAYPFAMSWSETSRYYYPALFLGQKIFGQKLAWPILHPSLHLLLAPPYLLDAPLWFHRAWQVGMRFLLVGLIAPALLSRLKIEQRILRWLAGVWIFLYLFTLPLYLHLAVPVFMLLWGFSVKNDGRTWFWLALASIWAGLSRLNWYPMPGILVTALYCLEVPVEKRGWRYLIKPAAWFVSSTVLAFVSMQIYIALSGLGNFSDFYTSLISTKLWYRLWPNDSYWLGVLPGILIFSAPLWLGIWLQRTGWNRLRISLLLSALLVLFAGGLVVSMKIGGGADIHNMDAYAVLLLVIFGYVFSGRITPERTLAAHSVSWHWSSLALLVLVPAWFATQGTASFWQYDAATAQGTLTALQRQVDTVNASDGKILFITQRQLISMHMLKDVHLVQEYEREELMEMAMAQNETYMQVFRADLEKHRFAAIIVDPLRFNFAGEEDAMGAENNAWTRYVVKRILCNYKEKSAFPADRITIYVPQVGEQKCP